MINKKILQLTKQLYPKSFVWKLFNDSIFYFLHMALSRSENEILTKIKRLQNSTLPDNNEFDEFDAARWNNALAITNENLELDIFKMALIRKINFPGDIKTRQNYLYLQGELNKAGFNVFVHENKLADIPYNPAGSTCGLFLCGEQNVGEVGIQYDIIANDIYFDSSFLIASNLQLRFSFFIGGENFLDRAEIPLNRKSEFINLILKLKPAQTIGLSLIDFTI